MTNDHTSPLEVFSNAVADIAEKASPAIASVAGRHRHSSSAYHWRDGLFIAADERVGDDDIEMTFDGGETRQAELVGRDASTGIALLKPANAPSLPTLAMTSVPARVGSLAVALGRADANVLAALGSVSLAGPAWRSMRGGAIDRRLELAIGAGLRFEGGAALDASGGLIGLLLFGPWRKTLIIPAATVERVAAALADKGYVPRGYLGAGLHPMRRAGGSGAIILSIEDGGPAAQAGLFTGDVITTWNGEELAGVRDILRRLGPDSVGKVVSLGIVRAGQTITVDLTVGARPHR